MLKICGALFLLSGCIGYGISVSNNLQSAINEVKEFVYMYQLLRSAISYQKETLPDACRHAGEKIDSSLGCLLRTISDGMEKDRQNTFSHMWKMAVNEYFSNSFLSKKQKEYILRFPDYIGFSDENMQILVIDEYISTLSGQLSEMEKKIVERKRVIMGVSAVSGMILTILLL